jgi:hypothetical protein
MLKGIGSFIGMALLLLAAGCMAGYIYGGVQWSTYRALARAVSAFWWASGLCSCWASCTVLSSIDYRRFVAFSLLPQSPLLWC